VGGVVTDITPAEAGGGGAQRPRRQLRQAQRLEALAPWRAASRHDFNNILAAMLAMAKWPLRGGGAPKGSQLHRDLDNVMIAGERGRALIDRILAFSRSGVGERAGGARRRRSTRGPRGPFGEAAR